MPDPLRVAWFGHGSGRRADGLSSYSEQMVTALAGHDVQVLFFCHRLDGDRAPVQQAVRLRAARFKTVVLPLPGSRRRIARELARFKPHVVHVSLSHSLLDAWVLRVARRRRIPTVVTVHLPYAPASSARGRVLRALYRFHHAALARADRCIALSGDQRDLLLSIGCDAARIDVVPNGVDTASITPGHSRLRSELGASFVVAYVGRLDPEKRVHELVRAFMRQPWPDDHVLLIAGAGVMERRLRRTARDDPRVRLLGAVHERARCVDILRAADVFVLPSTAEGLSLSLLEAMSAGCAIIATDVAEDGAAVADAGIRIPVRPLDGHLDAALQRLHDDVSLRAALGQRARRRACSAYSLRTRVERLLRTYGELCGDTAHAA